MQNPSDALLILSPEERDAAQAYIQQRLRILEGDQVADVQDLIQCARRQMQRLQAERERLRAGTTPTAQIMFKLTTAALSGLSSLVSECNRAAHILSAPSGAASEEASDSSEGASDAAGGTPAEADAAAAGEVSEELAGFLLTPTPEEEGHAETHIQARVDGMSLEALERFRDACRELLTWWESERGQSDGLLMAQFGDTQSAAGRVAIRQEREALRQHVLNPFKRFYQQINQHYQRVSRSQGRANGA